MSGTARGFITLEGSGVHGDKLGRVGGSQNVGILKEQLPVLGLQAQVNDPGHPHGGVVTGFTGGSGIGQNNQLSPIIGATAPATTGITVTIPEIGQGLPHTNMPPVTVRNIIIYTGVV
jgi:microcystin-dependent protein